MPLATFLNGRAPTRLRGLQFLAFSDVANIQARSSTSDAGGGATTTWTTTGTVNCRIDPLTDRGSTSRLIGGRIDERSTHVVTVPAGVAMNAANRVLVAGRGTFEVTATHERTAEWASSFEVLKIT